MKILITGGAGFIGAHTAAALLERGDSVVLVDDFNDLVYPGALKRARLDHMFPAESRPRLITGSVLDDQLLDSVFVGEKIDVVLHFAAHANPATSLQYPADYTAVNVLGTEAVLDACSRHEVGRVIFAGTSSVYDDTHTPFREDQHPLRPRSPYGASKEAAEVYCRLWHEWRGLSVTVLRFFSVYGPWGRPDMAPMIFARQISAGEALKVTRDRRRDFTYIDDIVAGIVAAVDHPFDYEVINIGRGEPVGLDELIAALEAATGKKAVREWREAPAGEMAVTYADISKAKRLLGYEPKVSVQEGTKRMVEWMRTAY